MREVASFLRGHAEADITLVMVEADPEVRAAMLSARHAEPGLAPDPRFLVSEGSASLAALRSGGTPGARVLVNPANQKLNGKGMGVNKEVHAAAGLAALEALTRAAHPTVGVPGEAYPVHLPAGNPLREAEGVEVVLHAVGPNMNPDKPSCLNGDYTLGQAQLGDTYKAVFTSFISLKNAAT